ncbi:MAG: TIGR01906 family membrane protein [Dehalococcoidia bacterium]|nr:MAG: TIGR01906 family membrane protein [Dehalococcoidia bacterium]
MKALIAITSILFVICIPMLLLTTDLRFAANDIRLYEYGFNKYEVSAATGLDNEELLSVADQMITYFNSDEELLDIGLFEEHEVTHLKDVKGLIQLAYRLQLASLAYIVVYIVINFVLRRGAFWRGLARRLIWGSGATIALLAVLGVWAVIAFDSLFLLFHLVSFSNELWQLSPGDKLLLIFPQGFFNDAALFVAAAAIGEAIIIGGVAWGVLALRGKANYKKALLHSNGEGES